MGNSRPWIRVECQKRELDYRVRRREVEQLLKVANDAKTHKHPREIEPLFLFLSLSLSQTTRKRNSARARALSKRSEAKRSEATRANAGFFSGPLEEAFKIRFTSISLSLSFLEPQLGGSAPDGAGTDAAKRSVQLSRYISQGVLRSIKRGLQEFPICETRTTSSESAPPPWSLAQGALRLICESIVSRLRSHNSAPPYTSRTAGSAYNIKP